MSNHWDIHCVTCGVTSRIGLNHGDKAISSLCVPSVARALGALGAVHGVDIEMPRLLGADGSLDVEWFAAHAEHRLVPIDEYGRLATECGAWVACEHCGSTSGNCVLEPGHDGSHVRKAKT